MDLKGGGLAKFSAGGVKGQMKAKDNKQRTFPKNPFKSPGKSDEQPIYRQSYMWARRLIWCNQVLLVTCTFWGVWVTFPNMWILGIKNEVNNTIDYGSGPVLDGTTSLEDPCTDPALVFAFIISLLLFLFFIPLFMVGLWKNCCTPDGGAAARIDEEDSMHGGSANAAFWGEDSDLSSIARIALAPKGGAPKGQLTELHEVVVVTQRMPLALSRTRMVTFLPRYVLVNETDLDLQVGQRTIDLWLLVPKREPDGTTEPIAWHWPSAQHWRRMVLKAVAPKVISAGGMSGGGRRGSIGAAGRCSLGGQRLSIAGGKLKCGGADGTSEGQEIPGPVYDASMPFKLAREDHQMDAFIIKSRPSARQEPRIAKMLKEKDSHVQAPIHHFVIDQKMRGGVIFVHIRPAVSRDTNLFISNATGMPISVSQRRWTSYFGMRVYNDPAQAVSQVAANSEERVAGRHNHRSAPRRRRRRRRLMPPRWPFHDPLQGPSMR